MPGQLFGIVSLIFGIAILTLLLNPRSNTVGVVGASSTALNSILRTLTLQGDGSGVGF